MCEWVEDKKHSGYICPHCNVPLIKEPITRFVGGGHMYNPGKYISCGFKLKCNVCESTWKREME